MAKGKRFMDGPGPAATPRRFRAPTALLAVGLVALALAGVVELSMAYQTARSSVDNTFILGTVAPSVVEETFDPATGIKKNVSVKNDGNAPAYIRALVLITWQDASGATLSAQPAAGTDYLIDAPEAGWALGSDGYYYYTTPVQPGDPTSMLIPSLTEQNNDTSRHLCVDVIAQAVQTSPAEAVSDVFHGATVGADGVLIPPAAAQGGEGA